MFCDVNVGSWMYKQMVHVSTKSSKIHPKKLEKTQNNLKWNILCFFIFCHHYFIIFHWNAFALFVQRKICTGVVLAKIIFWIYFSDFRREHTSSEFLVGDNTKNWNVKIFVCYCACMSTQMNKRVEHVSPKIRTMLREKLENTKILDFMRFWGFPSFVVIRVQFLVETCFICLYILVLDLAPWNEKNVNFYFFVLLVDLRTVIVLFTISSKK